jgi:histidinol-phosphate aminotransferase
MAPTLRPDETRVAAVLERLRARCGSRPPSAADVERALPGLVAIDASAPANPYATAEVVARLAALPAERLARLVADRPAGDGSMAGLLAAHVGVPPAALYLAVGADRAVHALLASTPGPVLVSIPTFPSYYELARGRLHANRLDARDGFRIDLGELERLAVRHRAATVVVAPGSGAVDRDALVALVERLADRVRQVIVDERLAGATDPGTSLAPLAAELPHLAVVGSPSASHGVAGLRLGYAAMVPPRAWALRAAHGASGVNGLAAWFCGLLADRGFARAWEAARLRHRNDARRLLAGLAALPGVTAHARAATFALLELDRPATPVVAAALARHGVYLRDCAGTWGLDGERFVGVAAGDEAANDRILAALRDVLATPAEGRWALAAVA